MSFTWTGDPTASDVEAIRHYTGDTDSKDALLSDEEIQFELDETGDDVPAAADRCFRRILARLSHKADRTAPRFNAQRSQRFNMVKESYAEFQSEHYAAVPAVVWSEHSKADADAIDSDSDFQQPKSSIGQDEMP